MNTIRIILFTSLFLCCGAQLLAMGHNYPRGAHQQTLENDYRSYVVSGIARQNGLVLGNAQKTEFLNQLLNWVQNAQAAPELLQKLERSAMWAKILLDKREEFQRHHLLNDDALKNSAKNCQALIEELVGYYNEALNEETNKLFNHSFIWWAMLSIRRTGENYDQAWTYLNMVEIRKYRNVAKLWKAHLILINKYAPPGIPNPLAEARNLLYPPELQRVVAVNANNPVNLVAALVDAQNQQPLLHGDPPANIEGVLPNPLLVVPEPPAQNNLLQQTIAPPSFQNMGRMRKELREELLHQEITALAGAAPEASSDSESSNHSDDDSSEDDDDNPPAVMDVANPPYDHPSPEHSPSHEDSETSADEDIDWETDEDENVQTFLTLLGTKVLDEIDQKTLRFIKNKNMDSQFAKLLTEKYSELKIVRTSTNRTTKPAIDEAITKREKGLPILVLLHHYSLLLDKKPASQRFFKFFKPYFPLVIAKVGNLRMYFDFPGKKSDSSNRIPLFLQFLAYREEINIGNVRFDTVTQAYNRKHEVKFSNFKLAFLKDKEAPDEDIDLLEEFKANPASTLEKLNSQKGKFLPGIAVLWHYLEKTELPEKNLEIIPVQEISTRFTLDEEQEQFFKKIWPQVPKTPRGHDYQVVLDKFAETFGVPCPLSVRAMSSRFTRWKKTQPINETEEPKANLEVLKNEIGEKLKEHFLTQKEWVTYKGFLKKYPQYEKKCTRGIFNGIRESLESIPEVASLLPELKAPTQEVAFLTQFLKENFEKGIKVTYRDYEGVVADELKVTSRTFDHYRGKIFKKLEPTLQKEIKQSTPSIEYARNKIMESFRTDTNLVYKEFLKNHPKDIEPISAGLFNSMKGKLKKANSQPNIGKKRAISKRKEPQAKRIKNS